MNKLRKLFRKCDICCRPTGDVEKCLSINSRATPLARAFLNGEMKEHHWDYFCERCRLKDVQSYNMVVFLFKDYNPKKRDNNE